ncbi:oxysterol-binding protein 1 isoform X2 [Ctenocephalides felis]|uniref:oxysterol-binding protein 1 isoform X2 n=1 Tax=Ctenocephalides felis TaxID=7515 RepID=UPI000E6E26E4|nr:oxysterol-binding protein 1 isoform X2 [Ctenocephalides felis]
MSDSSIKTAVQTKDEPEMKGWLLKWTNYLKGYQRRWFVLSNGVLSYYRNQAEMAHTCRGTISLHGALIHTADSCTFVISNGGTQTFHIKAGTEVERQSWVTALELAKAKAIRAIESEEEEEDNTTNTKPAEELYLVIRELSSRLEDLQTCAELVSKHGAALQRALNELEQTEEVTLKSKAITEKTTLFRIASTAMINACKEYQATAQAQGHKWSKMLQHERDQKLHLEEMVEQLARQHSNLEKAATRHRPNGNANTSNTDEDDEDEHEFYDAQEGYTPTGAIISSNTNLSGGNAPPNSGTGVVTSNKEDSSFILKIPLQQRRNSEGSSGSDQEDKSESKQVLVVASETSDQLASGTEQKMNNSVVPVSNALIGGARQRRTRVPDKPNYPLNLWSIMKNCIGKELSKIPMPVNFSEPLSMLQRLTEDYEYADILDQAARCSDMSEQLAYVAAFTVSSYATTSDRTAKPFNPLLGETYECDRTMDLGWRAISEQVSHHPPMVAQFCEGKGWKCWQEFTMTSKFRGKYLQVIPLGTAHVEFDNGNRYSWRKVTTTVHNIIVGKLWVDQHGDMEIVGQNNASGVTCHLKYIPYSYFTRDTQRKVKGVVVDNSGQVSWVVNGTWDCKIEIAKVISTSGSAENPVYKTGTYKVAWQRRPLPEDAEKYYNFTVLAAQLNEPEEGVAPTDTRLRPDQRLMEEGLWTEANKEKVRLEEKQRARRREREAEAELAAKEGRPYPPYEPLWFTREQEPGTENVVHVYSGKYWEAKAKQDWSNCPDIF